ncbi:membrane protein [Geobacillus genomosp. 3]|uniref:Membrane protein n=1 Tax=Geobacillus genomosp. 3 TaxID=1921421 RepID=S5ZHX0_GEOG3|nr:YybS family protein [Geobacillus genomosp. 3]AGT33860.1 membrane protein [Geobacillus genomosp. 3]
MRKTHALTEAAIELALFAVLFLLALYVPFIGVIAVLFLALPFMVFTMRHGLASACLLLIASLVVSGLIGSLLSLPMALMFGTVGIAVGAMLAKKKNRYLVLLVGALVFLVNIVLDYVISIQFLQVDMIQDTLALVRESFDTAMRVMEGMGQEPPAEMQKQLEQGIELIGYMIPTLFVIASFALAYVTIVVSLPILKRLKLPVGTWPPFRELSLPKSVLWIYILVLVFSLFPIEEGTFPYIAVLNISYVLQLAMIVQGFSFLYYAAYKKGIGKGVVVAGTVICLFLPFLLYLVAIFGIIDVGFDLRRRI